MPDIEYHIIPINEANLDEYVGKVDILSIDQNFRTVSKIIDREIKNEVSLKMAHDIIQKIKPKICVILRSAYPAREIAGIVPAANDYKTILGKIVILPFTTYPAAADLNITIFKPADYMAEMSPFNYELYRKNIHVIDIERIWKSFSIGFYDEYDEYGSPHGTFKHYSGLAEINGLCRCFDCAAHINLFAWYLYKFDKPHFNEAGVIKMFKKLSDYSYNLYLPIEYPRPLLEYVGTYFVSQRKELYYPHGVYRNLSRFETHKKWLAYYKNTIYNKFFTDKSTEIDTVHIQTYNEKACNELPEATKKEMSKYVDIICQKEFQNVKIDENIVILNELFGFDGIYNQYKKHTEGTGCYELIESIAKMPEIILSDDDMIYNPNSCAIKKRVPQEVYYLYDKNKINASKFLRYEHNELDSNNPYSKHENVRKISQFKSLTHCGKIKLFIADLQALLYLLPREAIYQPKNGNPPKFKVLYIGSAPGTQTAILAEKFKNVHFILYDGAKFSNQLSGRSNVELHNELFTDDKVALYKDKIHILISDIRKELSSMFDNTESMINEDMTMQKEWVYGTRPILGSMLKFRPPYPFVGSQHTEYKYLGGKVYWQVFPWHQSTEGRLLSTHEDIMKGDVPFDFTQYDNSSLEHNIRRVWCTYKAGVLRTQNGEFVDMPELHDFPGFDRCLDCTYLLNVCSQFVEKFYDNYNKDAVIEFMRNILYRMRKPLLCICEGQKLNPHGLWSNRSRFRKHEKFIKLWDNYLINLDGLESSQSSAVYLNKK